MQINQNSPRSLENDSRKPKKQKKKEQQSSPSNTSDQLSTTPTKSDTPIQKKPLPLFKTAEEQGDAEKYLNRLSGGAFDPVRSVDDQFVNLRTFHDMYEKDPAFMAQMQNVDFNSSNDKATVALDDLENIGNTDDMKSQMLASLKKNAALGSNPSDEEVQQYMQDNVNAIAQQLGADLGANYEGFVSMVGDVNAFSSLNARGGVCSDIHAAITAFRASMGQESYMIMTSGSDAAHVFNAFKEDGKWYIQNYGKIVETSAQTLSELYDQVMPEQRRIRLYEIDKEGNPHQVLTDHLTRTGRAERRFGAESGVGTFNPWTAQEGIHIGSDDVSFYKNGFYVAGNERQKKGAVAYYKKESDGSTEKIQGFAVEGQYQDDNGNGYQRRYIDAKYDSEKRWVTDKTFGRSHFSVHGGYAGPEADPVYWQDDPNLNDPAKKDDVPPAARLGVSYERNGSRLYGEKDVKFELGYQTKIGGTVTANAQDPLAYDFVGRIYGDAVGEAKMVTGVFYQPNRDLTVRAGLASGVDLTKIDGYQDPVEQLKNVAESDAYVDIRYGKGPIAAKVMGEVPLHNPTQYKIGTGVAIAPTKNFAIGATYINERVVNDNIDSFRIGAEVRPTNSVALGAHVTTPIMGDNVKNTAVGGYVNFKF